jgi:hypothetical protein
MDKVKRAWINQPSTSQDYHSLHGKNILVEVPKNKDEIWLRAYFLDGDVVSQFINKNALENGWTTARGQYRAIYGKDADTEMLRDKVMTMVDNLVDKEVQWSKIKDSDMTQPEWDKYHNAIAIAKDRIRTVLREL